MIAQIDNISLISALAFHDFMNFMDINKKNVQAKQFTTAKQFTGSVQMQFITQTSVQKLFHKYK